MRVGRLESMTRHPDNTTNRHIIIGGFIQATFHSPAATWGLLYSDLAAGIFGVVLPRRAAVFTNVRATVSCCIQHGQIDFIERELNGCRALLPFKRLTKKLDWICKRREKKSSLNEQTASLSVQIRELISEIIPTALISFQNYIVHVVDVCLAGISPSSLSQPSLISLYFFLHLRQYHFPSAETRGWLRNRWFLSKMNERNLSYISFLVSMERMVSNITTPYLDMPCTSYSFLRLFINCEFVIRLKSQCPCATECPPP